MSNSEKILAFIIIFCISFGTVSLAQNESIDLNSIPKNWSEIIEKHHLDRVISDEDKVTPIWKTPSITSSEEDQEPEIPKENNTQYSPCNRPRGIGNSPNQCAPGWGI